MTSLKLLFLLIVVFVAVPLHAQIVPPSTPSGNVQQDTSCYHSWMVSHLLNYDRKYAEAYDTSKAFVERCPFDPLAPSAFGDMALDVSTFQVGEWPQSLVVFRNWLISALAWNTISTTYFCSDVHAMSGTFPTGDTTWTGQNVSNNKALSVIYWLLRNPQCSNSGDSELYVNSRESQRETWRDSQDTNKVKLDTTVYSMHDLGLDSVLKYAQLLGVGSGSRAPAIVTSAFASPEPVEESTSINFTTSREAYVKIDLFDLLGKRVTINGFEGVVEPGDHSVPISLRDLLSSTYFARIQTTYGEIQTVKIVKK